MTRAEWRLRALARSAVGPRSGGTLPTSVICTDVSDEALSRATDAAFRKCGPCLASTAAEMSTYTQKFNAALQRELRGAGGIVVWARRAPRPMQRPIAHPIPQAVRAVAPRGRERGVAGRRGPPDEGDEGDDPPPPRLDRPVDAA